MEKKKKKRFSQRLWILPLHSTYLPNRSLKFHIQFKSVFKFFQSKKKKKNPRENYKYF